MRINIPDSTLDRFALIDTLDLTAVASWIQTQWESAHWTDVRGFWLKRVLDDRLLVIFALPVCLLLLVAPRRRLRPAIIVTGLAFLAFLFGVLHVICWVAFCLMFYALSGHFAREVQRVDRAWQEDAERVARGEAGAPPRDFPWGPSAGAVIFIAGWFLAIQALKYIPLPGAFEAFLHTNAPWMFPWGMRGLPWEPMLAEGAVPLIGAAFYDHHLIGTAYLAIRMMHYFFELRHNRIPDQRRTLLNFFAWLCYAPNVMQGPIERFVRFQDELDTCHERRSWQSVFPAVWRIGLGVAKAVIATVFFQSVLYSHMKLGSPDGFYKHPENVPSFWLLYFGVVINIYWLYLEFSGYCDISAGIARLLGYRQIENFNHPWIATSLRDFWRRWHISLSTLLRDCIYIPLGGNRTATTFNLCVTFGLCGLWHRPIPQVFIWGVVMGLMLSVNQWWHEWMKRIDEQPTTGLGRIRRGWLRCRPLPQICAWLVTMHAFMFSLLIFFGGKAGILVPIEILARLLEPAFRLE